MFPWCVFALIFSLTTKISGEVEQGVYFQIEENAFLSDENTLHNEKADSLMACARICARKASCKSANFLRNEGTCSLLGKARRTSMVEKFVKRDGSFYVEKVVSPGISSALGSTQPSIVPSCQTLLNQSPPFSSGVYWIDPDGGSQDNAFQAYCDMETDGGGWTLVWSYTFTNYNEFTDRANAITPRPNWQVRPEVDVPISTTPPLNETDYNAMKFSLWKQLGRQVLIKSNINNWLVCHPGTGSLVDWQEGIVSCQIIKHVTDTCKDTPAPSKFSPSQGYGPILYSSGYWSSTYYYFDGYTDKNWPDHDPCGRNQPNQVKNVANPHGNIFVRP